MLLRLQKNNYEGGVYEEIIEGDFVYYGPILKESQIKCLKEFGNTVISHQLYEMIPEKKLKSEIKTLTGLDVSFNVKDHYNDGTEISVIINVINSKKQTHRAS